MTDKEEVKPDSSDMWLQIGNDHYKKSEYEKALIAYDKAIEKMPGKEEIWYRKGITLAKIEKHEEAKIVFGRTMEIEPYHTGGCGYFYYDSFEARQRAIERYDEALKTAPDDERVLYAKGFALVNQGQYEKAIECFDMVLGIDPDNVKGWRLKGVALEMLGQYGEARICFDKAIEIDSKIFCP